ncbi:HNH endonuclease [Saccharospirillum impatiens]|uniref:HNH endonuclease n=1 Tax=Saccharospirillum impatiens TaxID=169438 RepID=UPI0004087710|nr:HNH endonuclease signature motif containing protein [Saccharospirillum impatiens]
MARRSKRNDPEILRKKLVDLLVDFEKKLLEQNLRDQVRALIPANHQLRDLGSSLVKDENADSARDRVLSYLRKYPGVLVQGDELMIVAGISEYARRIRELRVENGWPVFTGQAYKEAVEDEGSDMPATDILSVGKTDTYILTEDKQDRDAAHRWNLANEIRKSNLGVKSKLLKYFRENLGKRITGEELKYLAKGASEWPRRVRELRTEDGWPIATRMTGMPSLPVGVYLLEEDRQAPVHDRKIPDSVRVKVLERDDFCCRFCGWDPEKSRLADRYRSILELHHIEHHAKGGANTQENLITLCNICHDDTHRGNISKSSLLQKLKGS